MQKSAATFFYASAQRGNDRSNKKKHSSTCTPSSKKLYENLRRFFCDNQNCSIWTVKLHLSKTEESRKLWKFPRRFSWTGLESRLWRSRRRVGEWHVYCPHAQRKNAQELFAETQSPQDAYEIAFRREKCIEHSRTMKTNPFGGQRTPMEKQEPTH